MPSNNELAHRGSAVLNRPGRKWLRLRRILLLQPAQFLPLAEEMNHHPDVLIHGYKLVKVMLFTHSLNSITDKDYELAKKIDEIWRKYI